MTAQGSAASEARRNHCSEALWSVAASPDGPDSNDINELAAWVEMEIRTATAAALRDLAKTIEAGL